VSEPTDICICNHSRLNHDPEWGCWDDCDCKNFVLRVGHIEAPDLLTAIAEHPENGSFTPERTYTKRDLDLAVLEARQCALLCVAERLNHVADGYLKGGLSHRAHMLNVLVAEILSSQFMQRVADLQKQKAELVHE
jgi:hypothetical protein